jgi:integrase
MNMSSIEPAEPAMFPNSVSKWLRLSKESGISFTIHDLRRTFLTIAESLDIPAYAVKRLANHKMSNDVTAGYIVTDVERLRQPMQKITDYILKCAGYRPSATVTDLSEKKSHKTS